MPHFTSTAQYTRLLILKTLVLTCLFASSLTLAQPATTILKGKVIVNHQGGSAGTNIVISAEGGQQTTTDSNGRFTMVFDKKPGEPYELLVNKKGWVVINSHVLTGHLPSEEVTKHSTPLSIIIAKAHSSSINMLIVRLECLSILRFKSEFMMSLMLVITSLPSVH